MYFIILLLLIFLFVGLLGSYSLIPVSISSFIDMPSLAIILLFSVPILVASGLWKDMTRSFKVVNKRFKFTRCEIKRSYEAVSLFIKLLMNAAILTIIVQIVIILKGLDDMAALGPNIAVACLALFYATIINLILHSVKSMLKARMIGEDYIEDVVVDEKINENISE